MHDKAAEAYDAKMAEVFANVHDRPATPPQVSDTSPSARDIHVVKVLDAAKIRGLRLSPTDHAGERTACYFTAAGRQLALDGEAHKLLQSTIFRIADMQEYRDQLGIEYLYDLAIAWLQARIESPVSTVASFTSFLLARVASDVCDRELWLPLPVVQFDVEFTIGQVAFRRITKAMMDDLASTSKVDDEPEQRVSFGRLRSQLQATGAACVSVRAEPHRARMVAEERAELSVAMLRLACPAILTPHQWAPIYPTELEQLHSSTVLEIRDGRISSVESAIHPRMLGQWRITSAVHNRYMRLVWKFAHVLLTKPRNEFQETVLGAMLQYSRSLLKADASERLLYVISALEAVFVSKGEPIGQALRERIAILKAPPAEDRVAFMRLVTEVYEHRSAFVHRGLGLSDPTLLERFLVEAWSTLIFVLNNHDKWRTKDEFLNALDHHKFAAPMFSTRGMTAV